MKLIETVNKLDLEDFKWIMHRIVLKFDDNLIDSIKLT